MKYICRVCGKEFDTEELGSLPYFDDLHEINKHVMKHVNVAVYEDTCRDKMFFDIYVTPGSAEPTTDTASQTQPEDDPSEKDVTTVYRWLKEVKDLAKRWKPVSMDIYATSKSAEPATDVIENPRKDI